MVTRIGGFRRKTRSKLKKNIRQKGKISINDYFKTYNVGDKVGLIGEPAVQKGMFFPRFKGRTGIVTGKQGKCYKIELKDGKNSKTFIVHPVHLKELRSIKKNE